MVKKRNTTFEILETVRRPPSEIVKEIAVYICGSSYEGTTTTCLKSDIDIVYVLDDKPIVANISEEQQYPDCLLLVQDSYTPAGYVKLQHVLNGVPLRRSLLRSDLNLETDLEERVLFTIPREISCPGTLQQGPARSKDATVRARASDYVPAFRCRSWPDCASKWLTRPRKYKWPTQDQLDKCKTLGCFFVQVGHPTSAEKDLQWRLSFTLQERMLVSDFNSVQLKCYILLKMIKKDILQKCLGEESLTSYHFKSCMFYMIETTHAELWTVDNLLVCLHKCLAMVLDYVERGNCPNYFIPEENMFEGRIFGHMQTKLCEVLRRLLSADFKFLLGINCDSLGAKCEISILSGVIDSGGPSRDLTIYEYVVYLTKLRNKTLELETRQNSSAEDLYQLKLYYSNIERVTEHSVDETRDALSFIIPYVDLSLKSDEFVFNLLSSNNWHEVGLVSDSFSARLKQAYLFNALEYYEMSSDILIPLLEQVGHTISGCSCSDMPGTVRDLLEALSHTWHSSLRVLFHRYWIPCVIFLPAERELAPPVLCHEMDRSVGSPPETKEGWYDWAVVDGKILLYFLLYLNHMQLHMEADAAADIDNIRWLLQTDRLLGHRETAFNLLGWIYKEKGLHDQAVECFQESLSVKSSHNAAYLHLQDISSIQ